jgi:sugar lactone lactonase YvrE
VLAGCAEGIVLDASGRTAYVSLMDDGRIVAMDVPGRRVVWSFDATGSKVV